MSSPERKKVDGDPEAPSSAGVEANAPGGRVPPSDDDSPGVPGFRRWRSLYFFVFTVFVLTVIALAIFSRVYA